jgi:2,4-dienoyl-CoA reductase-like NADH-dependent reductase (Old Yellow Enzyme family)
MSKDALFTPLHLGAVEIPNRIIMAPLTDPAPRTTLSQNRLHIPELHNFLD